MKEKDIKVLIKLKKWHKAAKNKNQKSCWKKVKKVIVNGYLVVPVNTTPKLLVFSRRVLKRNAWDKPYVWPYLERNQFYVSFTYAQDFFFF